MILLEPLQLPKEYKHKVSFDNLFPDEEQYNTPPQYNVSGNSSRRGSTNSLTPEKPLDFGFSTRNADVQEVMQSFNSLNKVATGAVTVTRKGPAPKLPPAPERSILKNCREDNSQYILHDGSVAESNATTDNFSNLHEPEDMVGKRRGRASSARKKSIVEMTNEELLAMDSQYRAGVDLSKMDFDKQLGLYASGSSGSGNEKLSKVMESMIQGYPSRPSIRYKALTLTIEHGKFGAVLKQILQDKGTFSQWTRLTSARTLLCYISGRRHSWSALEWTLHRVVRTGDHLVVVTCVNEDEDREDIVEAVHILMNYVVHNTKGKVVKLTVEAILTHHTGHAMQSAVAAYHPSFIVCSSLSSNLYLKFESGNIKMPYWAQKHLNVPSIVIPDSYIDPEKLLPVEDVAAPHPVSATDFSGKLATVTAGSYKNPVENDTDSESLSDPGEYFPDPLTPTTTIEQFAKDGYIRPSLSSRASNSRRAKMLAAGPTVYKVKSLLSDDGVLSPAMSRSKSASSYVSRTHTNQSQASRAATNSSQKVVRHITPTIKVTEPKEEKKKSFWKKLGFGKK